MTATLARKREHPHAPHQEPAAVTWACQKAVLLKIARASNCPVVFVECKHTDPGEPLATALTRDAASQS